MSKELVVVGAYPPPLGGAEIGQQMLAEGLAQAGYGVTVLPVVEGPQALQRDTETNPLVLPELVTPYPRLTQKLGTHAVLEERNPLLGATDVEKQGGQEMQTHSQAVKRSFLSLQADVAIVSPLWHMRDMPVTDTPIIGIARGSDVRSMTPADSFAIDSIRKCAHVILISPSLMTNLRDLGIETPASVIMPALGQQFEKAPMPSDERSSRRRKIGITDDDILFGHVSTHAPVKRTPDLIEGFAKMKAVDVTDKAKLLIVGEGEDTPALRGLVGEHGLGDSVIFAGKIGNTDLVDYLDLMDVFVLSSKSEGLARAVLEAQSRGLPVITSNIPGPTDIIKDTENGLTYEVGDTSELGERMYRLTRERQFRDLLAAASRDKRMLFLDSNAWVNAHSGIIDSVAR